MDISKSGFQIHAFSVLIGLNAVFIAPSSEHWLENQSKQKAEAAENNGITAGHTNSYYLVFVISGGLSSLKSLNAVWKYMNVHVMHVNYIYYGATTQWPPRNPSKILQIFQIMLQNPSNRKSLMFYNDWSLGCFRWKLW